MSSAQSRRGPRTAWRLTSRRDRSRPAQGDRPASPGRATANEHRRRRVPRRGRRCPQPGPTTQREDDHQRSSVRTWDRLLSRPFQLGGRGVQHSGKQQGESPRIAHDQASSSSVRGRPVIALQAAPAERQILVAPAGAMPRPSMTCGNRPFRRIRRSARPGPCGVPVLRERPEALSSYNS